MSVKSKKESIKNAFGGIAALALFGSNYVSQTDVIKEFLFSIYWHYLEMFSSFIGLPAEIINVVIIITSMYVSLKVAEGSIKTLVIIGWLLIIILLIAKLVFSFSIASYLPGEQ